MSVMVVIAAMVGGWMVQMYLTYQQSMAFNRQVTAMRRQGTVSVGAGGKRYRGGRAFVAVALDDKGVVRDALTLSGWTTFSRGKRLDALVGVRTGKIRAGKALPGLTRQQLEAAQQAVDLAKTRVPVEAP
ncbi:MAG TPA: transcriptional regulator GutM [Nocardioidaceae bacterium]|nr:transcriptional regulator GutM [Nocardioidaceae bacterium]